MGAVILIRKDGAALMQLRDLKKGLRNSGMWVPPGGHAEPNEDIKTCATLRVPKYHEMLFFICMK